MTTQIEKQECALRAASQIFKESYGASVTVDGAYERVNEKINNFRQGIKYRRENFISRDALFHVISKRYNCTIEEAKWKVEEAKNKDENKSVDFIEKLILDIKDKNVTHWEVARKFDKTDHGGQKFITQQLDGTKIYFFCIDTRTLEFDLQDCSDKIRNWLISKGTSTSPEEVIHMKPAIRQKIIEITNWEAKIIDQALSNLELDDIQTLYVNHNSSQFRKYLVSAAYGLNKLKNKITVLDISYALLSLIENIYDEVD